VLDKLSEADYARIVDERWARPVTAAVRLVSVINDATQHIGQAAYVRGFVGAGARLDRLTAHHDPVKPVAVCGTATVGAHRVARRKILGWPLPLCVRSIVPSCCPAAAPL
jgi:hypothetical protein